MLDQFCDSILERHPERRHTRVELLRPQSLLQLNEFLYSTGRVTKTILIKLVWRVIETVAECCHMRSVGRGKSRRLATVPVPRLTQVGNGNLHVRLPVVSAEEAKKEIRRHRRVRP